MAPDLFCLLDFINTCESVCEAERTHVRSNRVRRKLASARPGLIEPTWWLGCLPFSSRKGQLFPKLQRDIGCCVVPRLWSASMDSNQRGWNPWAVSLQGGKAAHLGLCRGQVNWLCKGTESTLVGRK